jgi:hypothetical protein
MIIKCTDILKSRLTESELQYLIQDFKIIKTPGGANLAYRLGKDSEYIFPKLKSGTLCYVHTIPIDKNDLKRWTEAYNNNDPKVSDGVLIYVNDNSEYLLIFFLQEGAHEMANMLTDEDEKLMNFFAKIANAFIKDKSIIF